MRPGAISAYPHRDSNDYATCLAPIFKKNTETFDGIIDYIKTMFIVKDIDEIAGNEREPLLKDKDFFDLTAIENVTEDEKNQIISDLIDVQYNSIRDIKSEIKVTPCRNCKCDCTKKNDSVTIFFSEIAIQQTKSLNILQTDINNSPSKAYSANILCKKMLEESVRTTTLSKSWSRLMQVDSNTTGKSNFIINNIKAPSDDLD